MENNLSLSPKVKAYFVHALKGIGIRDFDQAKGESYEMSEAEIASFLDNATPLGIFEKISLATTHQLQNDEKEFKRLENCTAFKRHAVSNVLAGNDFKSQGLPNLEKERCDNFVNEVCNFNNICYQDALTQSTIEMLKAGIKEQKVLADADKENEKNWQAEVSAIWDLISDSPRLDWNEKVPANQQIDQENYNSTVYKSTLFKKAVEMLGNKDLANKFLGAKFDEKTQAVKLKVSDQVLATAKQICQGRGGKDLITQDVMLALMLDQSAEQAITFFQTRSQEQKALQDKGDKNVTRDNKIGNLMGKDGRKMVERAAINYDKAKKSVKKGKQMWKGYKKLYDRMLGFIGSKLFSGIMVGGFTDRMLARKGIYFGTKRNVSKEKIDPQPWEVEVAKDLKQFAVEQGKVAENFYEKTKARIMADKMRIANIMVGLNDARITPEKKEELNAQYEYLSGRVKAAENVIANELPKDKNDPLMQDAKYFAQLEAKILNESYLEGLKKPDQNLVDQTQEAAQDQNKNKQPKLSKKAKLKKTVRQKKGRRRKNRNLQNNQKQQEAEPKEQTTEKATEKLSPSYFAVKRLIDADKNKSGSAEMAQALLQFKFLSQGTMTPAKKEIRCNMAKELFNLPEDKIPDQEVNAMADRFLKNKLDGLKTELTTYNQDTSQTTNAQTPNCRMNVRQAFAEINEFVKDDLKENLYNKQYTAHQINEETIKVLHNAANELSR